MLTVNQIKDYADLRGVSMREIEAYGGISEAFISMLFSGKRDLTEDSHRKIVDGINKAYAAKKAGTIVHPDVNNAKAIKDAERAGKESEEAKTKKPTTKKETKKPTTAKSTVKKK